MSKKQYWTLNESMFTFWDKCKIFHWLCTEKIWTQGDWVRKLEEKWEQYTYCPHVIAVASGSAANELIALRRKWELEQEGNWPKNNKVAFAANSWISNCSVWINLGFEPVFIDPTGSNLCVTLKDIEKTLDKNPDVKTIFYTSLLGHTESIQEMMIHCEYRGVKLLMDNCESSFTGDSVVEDYYNMYNKNVNNFVTSSTSCYFSHLTSPNQELGLIFCQTGEESDWYRMARNHGMTRGMPDKYKNSKVHEDFDFYLMGSNYRTSNLICYMALLDFDRALKFSTQRQILSELFYEYLDGDKFEHPYFCKKDFQNIVPLAIPIIVKESANRPDLMNKVKGYLKAKGVATRPLIAGWLGYHTCFKKYNLNPNDFPRLVWLNDNAIYLGLHYKVTEKMVIKIAKEISKL